MLLVSFFFISDWNISFFPFFLVNLNVKLKNSTGQTREQQQSGLNILNELKYKIQAGTRSNHISNSQEQANRSAFLH